MKIAYVTIYDSEDIHAWSGTGKNILKAIEAAGIETEQVGNLSTGVSIGIIISRLKKLFWTVFPNGKKHLYDRNPHKLKGYAKSVEKILKYKQFDIIFSPGTLPVAYLKTKSPIVFWTDASFAGMVNFYSEFSNLSDETIHNGMLSEKVALENCSLAIYSSDWAAKTAIEHYDVDPNKVFVIPFGANVSGKRNIEIINNIANAKETKLCKLLFIGVDWERKGGDKVIAVADWLRNNGILVELNIVGCSPPYPTPDYVKCHGFISKSTEAGRSKIESFFTKSHFLILPTIADCAPVVLAEASSYGLPSLATNVGGITTQIVDNKNGWTFELDALPEEYGKRIKKMMLSKARYIDLARSSFEEYEARLNWKSAGLKLREVMEQITKAN